MGSEKLLTDFQRDMRNFIQKDLVAQVKEILQENKDLGVLTPKPATSRSGSFKFDDDAGSDANVRDAFSPGSPRKGGQSLQDIQNAMIDFLEERMAGLTESLENLQNTFGSMDMQMMTGLSDANTKLMESLAESSKSFNNLQTVVAERIESGMEEIKTSLMGKDMNVDSLALDGKLTKLVEGIQPSFDQLKESLKETVAANSEEVELRRKLETLQNENNELEDALKRAGSDKLHAMARLNNELEHLRGHVKRLQERKP